MLTTVFYDQADNPVYIYFVEHTVSVPGTNSPNDETNLKTFVSFQVFSHWTDEQMWTWPWVKELHELLPKPTWLNPQEAEQIVDQARAIAEREKIPFEGSVFSSEM